MADAQVCVSVPVNDDLYADLLAEADMQGTDVAELIGKLLRRACADADAEVRQ